MWKSVSPGASLGMPIGLAGPGLRCSALSGSPAVPVVLIMGRMVLPVLQTGRCQGGASQGLRGTHTC